MSRCLGVKVFRFRCSGVQGAGVRERAASRSKPTLAKPTLAIVIRPTLAKPTLAKVEVLVACKDFGFWDLIVLVF